jgi:serine phosphatase RsbU (regulator of sigma subunit)
MGRGLQAAAIMGQLRATARAHAALHRSPAQVLAQLDVATTRLEQEAITTCLYAVLDSRTGELTVASAGHLAPLVVSPGREPFYLPVEPGLPLGAGTTASEGAGNDPPHPELTVVLPPASTLVLFTDGLVEDRARPLDVGLQALARVAGESVRDPEEFCDRALAVLGRDTRHADDTAMLVVTLDPGGGVQAGSSP